MKNVIVRIAVVAVAVAARWADPEGLSSEQQKKTSWAAAAGPTYRIDKPGTITFTVGVKIKGKVEKPQVMIFLPKERPFYEKATFSHSFSEDLMKPLPFSPLGN